jgi:DNA-binding CsgD family transcriptional regulator
MSRLPPHLIGAGWNSLTRTEVRVAHLVADGMTNPQIAAELGLSRRTIATHVSHILGKLDSNSRAEIAREVITRRRPVGALKRQSRFARSVTGVGLFVAGRRRAHLRDAWLSDLYDEKGKLLPIPTQLRHVTGYLVAAIRYRLVNDLGDALGKVLDGILVSRIRTAVVVISLFAAPTEMLIARQGLYGLIANDVQLGVIASALCVAVKSARAWRGVRPPKRDKEEDPLP